MPTPSTPDPIARRPRPDTEPAGDRCASGERAGGSDYAQLARRVNDAQLLRRRSGYYAGRITLTLALWLAGWAMFTVIGDTWWQLAVAAYLAIVFTQLSFLGHDAGHHQIFRTGSDNRRLGFVLGDLLIGLSYGWWVDKHNRHHAHPNDVEKDPDVGVGALVFTTGQAAASRGVARLIYRYQAFAFFPLLLLEGINLRVSGVRHLLARDRRGELALLSIHVAGYLALVFLLLPPGLAIAFVAVHQGLFGLYLGCSFAPNHKGMPQLSAVDARDYLRRQVLTSRNVTGGPVIDFALGGLNYQIEHHLFPSMPRPNLRHAQPIVAQYCAERGIPYCRTSLFASYGQALRHLGMVGRSTRSARTHDAAFAGRGSGGGVATE